MFAIHSNFHNAPKKSKAEINSRPHRELFLNQHEDKCKVQACTSEYSLSAKMLQTNWAFVLLACSFRSWRAHSPIGQDNLLMLFSKLSLKEISKSGAWCTKSWISRWLLMFFSGKEGRRWQKATESSEECHVSKVVRSPIQRLFRIIYTCGNSFSQRAKHMPFSFSWTPRWAADDTRGAGWTRQRAITQL